MSIRVRRSIIPLATFAARLLLCTAALVTAGLCNVALASESQHALWSVRGKTNTVYLLGSVHFLSPNEALPKAVDEAYADAEALVMEIDMDDLDPAQTQQLTFKLGVLPPGESLGSHMDDAAWSAVQARARELGLAAPVLERFRPWLAGLTLMQLHLMKLGLDPAAGVEQRLTAWARRDGKEITGLETLEQQLGMLAGLPIEQQREFLMYSIEDTRRADEEIQALLAAWRKGDVAALDDLMTEGMEKYPQLYAPLTVKRNRQWIPAIEALLDDREDYLVVVGTLHLVGKDSVLDLLRNRGHRIRQH